MKRNTKIRKKLFRLFLIITILMFSMTALGKNKNIILKDMGSFTFGGRVYTEENGETFHGDHGYAQYFIPEKNKKLPIVMWHGMGQSGKTWESTPEGKDGFWQILTKNNWSVYIIDQPGRGRAGRSRLELMDPGLIPTSAGESLLWNSFRLGEVKDPKERKLFENVKFSRDEKAMDEFYRWQTPDNGVIVDRIPDNTEYMAETAAKLFKKPGDAILLTHSASGTLGWNARLKSDKVKAIVAYEPGTYVYPEGENIPDLPSKIELAYNISKPVYIPAEEFKKLTEIPILIVYGDNIYESETFGIEFWRLSIERGRQFVELVNKYGGDAELVHLPEIGIKGNTHFPFADTNNEVIAKQLMDFLKEKKLNK